MCQRWLEGSLTCSAEVGGGRVPSGASNETRQRCALRESVARIRIAVRRSSCFRGHSKRYYDRHGAAGMSRHPASRKHDRPRGASLQWQDNLLLPIPWAAGELGDQDVLHAGDGDHLSVHQQYPRGRDRAGRCLESRSRAIGVQSSNASDAGRSNAASHSTDPERHLRNHRAAGLPRYPARREHDRPRGTHLQRQDILLLPIPWAAAELGDQNILHAGDGDYLSVHQQYAGGRECAGRCLESRSRAIDVRSALDTEAG